MRITASSQKVTAWHKSCFDDTSILKISFNSIGLHHDRNNKTKLMKGGEGTMSVSKI